MNTILIATDFSAAARNATEYGIKMAKYFNANIVLLHAYPIPPADYESGFAIEMIRSLREAGEEGLQKLKEEIVQKYQRDFHIQCVNEMGIAGDIIAQVAKTYNADLIVMGIVGEAGKVKEHLIGSNSVSVARHSDIPTLIVPEGVQYHPIHKIAFACDMDKTEESDVLYVTKYYANIFDAELDVIHVEKPQEELTGVKSKSGMFVEKKLENIKHKTVYTADTDPVKGLATYLKDNPCDLLITNPKKHSFFHNVFNESTTKRLAFHMPVPLLAIH